MFANIVLADEINRASPKTQSALLEAMEERQVTVDGVTYPLDAPFMVIATQNPIELEGTYPLPEAQLDRFLMRIEMGYPDRAAEVAILESQTSHLAVEELDAGRQRRRRSPRVADAIATVHVAAPLRNYIVDLADATRRHHDLALGASPRGALALQRAARALAASLGRDVRDARRREARRSGRARAPAPAHPGRRAARPHPGRRARRRPRVGRGPRGHRPAVVP